MYNCKRCNNTVNPQMMNTEHIYPYCSEVCKRMDNETREIPITRNFNHEQIEGVLKITNDGINNFETVISGFLDEGKPMPEMRFDYGFCRGENKISEVSLSFVPAEPAVDRPKELERCRDEVLAVLDKYKAQLDGDCNWNVNLSCSESGDGIYLYKEQEAGSRP